MRDGEQGEGVRLAMQTLIRYGEAFGARRLLPVKSAHLAGSVRIRTFKSYYEMMDRLVKEGGRFRVPTSVNPRPGYDYKIQNRFAFMHQRRHEEQLEALGAIPNYSCACYDGVNVPEFGDILGWAESSAVVYANSVIGARCNRNSIGIDLCSALTGYIPEFGYLLDENRRGQVMVKLDIREMDAPALGFLIGQRVVDKVPVLDHCELDRVQLKNLGGAAAASGAIALFHVLGVTPEAPDLEAAFQGKDPLETITITQRDLDSVRAEPSSRESSGIVAFGCPQMTFGEAMELGRHFVGKQVRKKTLFHLVPEAAERFRETEVFREVVKAGVEVHEHCPLAALTLRVGSGKRVLTNSGKLYYYLSDTEYGTLDDLLKVVGVA